MCFGLYYLLLLCNANRNASFTVAPNNSTNNVTTDVTVHPAVRGSGDKHKREVDLASLLQDVQTRLPKGIPLPPIFPPSNSMKKQASLTDPNQAERLKGSDNLSSYSVCLRPRINVTERTHSSKFVRPTKERLKETDCFDSVESDDDYIVESDNFSEPPPQKIHLRRRPAAFPRRKYMGKYYRRRQPRRRVFYSRIPCEPYYDSEEVPGSEEFFDEDFDLPSPPPRRMKIFKRRRQRLLSTVEKQESQDLRERLKEVLKQILNEANRQGHSDPVGMATGCHQKPVYD